ncbi:hypothetical protein [Chamaesiphon sp. VAR_48_metabat_403]|uniref:hypothetical protein n=1 Tax=Chamaesiphon sp. VAR_48_metabat_403 TaxID=2964700 RepID=UPI00286DA2DE|nr:hypothetical protein [Chamaesiphon sp. VAR_48_metabat_403]
MKLILIGISFSIGFLFLGVSTSLFIQGNLSDDDRDGAVGCLILGAPPTALGSWLLWDLRRQKRDRQRSSVLELESIFLQQLQANQGDITVVSFAVASKLPLEEAKKYLEIKSTQLNSTFHINEAGGTSYHFEI